MKKIVFSYLHYMGWGDTLISLFDIINCANYIRNNYPDLELNLVINDCAQKRISEIFPEVFDTSFFDKLFDNWIIQEKAFHSFCVEGKCEFNNELFTRIYSGRNYQNLQNVPGIFDVYYNDLLIEELNQYEIDYIKFTFENDGSSDIHDFPIFNKSIVEMVDSFIEKHLDNDFESVHYRIFDDPSKQYLDRFDDKMILLKGRINPNKKYFVTTNHGYVKKGLNEVINNSVFFITKTQHEEDMINGYNLDRKGSNDVISSIVELLIHSRSKKLYYYTDYSWVSYFTWYARNVKRVPYTDLLSLIDQ